MRGWGWPLLYLKVDLADPVGSLCHHDLLMALSRRLGVQTGVALMRGMAGHSNKPYWLGLEGNGVEVGKGLRQGDPASLIMWNVILDAASDRRASSGN